MKGYEELLQENQVLRKRLSRLNEVNLRINESLDFDSVLQGVLDSARSLMQARYGVITLFDASRYNWDFVSSGLTSEEAELLWKIEDGRQIFNYFNNVEKPMRMPDLLGFLCSLGISEIRLPMKLSPGAPFLNVPILHYGECLGHFFLADREGGKDFTQDDEDTLVMFASQAALVISNARRYRDEQRARINLETLIETSPVGVVVFDGKSGAVNSLNREALRIMERLGRPDMSSEDILKSITVRRMDGLEESLEESRMFQALNKGETLRAEEAVFREPGGGRVTALINATPIVSGDGEFDTFVVTMQDMTPLEEVEQHRAEFVGMVGHELRTPLATVRGSVSTLLDESSDLHPAEIRQFYRIIWEQTDRIRVLIADLLDVAHIETGTLPVSPEPTDLAVLASEVGNAFRLGGYRHRVKVDIPDDLPWVMADRSRIAQVLGNLLINAARHSPESSSIEVGAAQIGLHISVMVSDEGRGISADSLRQLFRKFSRVGDENQEGDTELGLAVCKGIVEAHGGRIWAESDGVGLGARFTFTLPTVEESEFVSPPASPHTVYPPSHSLSGDTARILAVDDDPQALRYIRDTLTKEGYAVVVTDNPEEASFLVAEVRPNVVLLDLMLPGVDGIELMKDILDESDVPVIFVSEYGQDRLIARAFEMGADDYVVKPFSPTELVARIQAAIRRRITSEPPTPYATGDLTIDYAERLVKVAGSPVSMTAIQYRLLFELSANAGRVLTYKQLLRRVWDSEDDSDIRPIRTAISAIRSKLEDNADNPTYIFTEQSVGYRMPRADTHGKQE